MAFCFLLGIVVIPESTRTAHTVQLHNTRPCQLVQCSTGIYRWIQSESVLQQRCDSNSANSQPGNANKFRSHSWSTWFGYCCCLDTEHRTEGKASCFCLWDKRAKCHNKRPTHCCTIFHRVGEAAKSERKNVSIEAFCEQVWCTGPIGQRTD